MISMEDLRTEAHLLTLGDVVMDAKGVPVESLESCFQDSLQAPDVVSQ